MIAVLHGACIGWSAGEMTRGGYRTGHCRHELANLIWYYTKEDVVMVLMGKWPNANLRAWTHGRIIHHYKCNALFQLVDLHNLLIHRNEPRIEIPQTEIVMHACCGEIISRIISAA